MRTIIVLLLAIMCLANVNAYLNIDVTNVPLPIPANGSNISVGQRFDVNVTSDGEISSGFNCQGIYDGTPQSYGVLQYNNTWNIMGFSNDGQDIPISTFQFRLHCWTAADFGASGDNYTPYYTFTRQPYQPTYTADDIAPAVTNTLAKTLIFFGLMVVAMVSAWFVATILKKLGLI